MHPETLRDSFYNHRRTSRDKRVHIQYLGVEEIRYKLHMSPESKRILGAVLIGLLGSGILVVPLCYALSQFRGFSVNTCHNDEVDGKTNQEIADLISFPLITLSKIPLGLPAEPRVFTDFSDAGCQLQILYGWYNEQIHPLEIRVYESSSRKVELGWKCDQDPSPEFETVCYRNVEYSGKRYGVMLRSPYSLIETQDLTKDITIPTK